MNFAEQQHRAHLERQRRLGKFALAAPSPPAVPQTRLIEALHQEIAELSAKLQALEHQDQSPLVPPSRIKPIIGAVAKYYGVPLRDLVSFRRARALIRARQVAMYLARTLTKHSLPAIGRVFERDHTTILHACRQIETHRVQDRNLDAEICELIEQLAPAVSTDHSNKESRNAEKETEEVRNARVNQRTCAL